MPKNKKKIGKKKLEHLILSYLKKNSGSWYSARQLQKHLKVKNGKKDITYAADRLLKKDVITKNNNGQYKLSAERPTASTNSQGKLLMGVVDKTRNGAAYIVIEGKEKDVFVPPGRMGTALHRDTVSVRMVRYGKRPEGDIVEVVSRHRDRFVGKLIKEGNQPIIETEDGKTHFDIRVHPNQVEDIAHGTIVVAVVERWPKRKGQLSFGRISTVLGKSGTNDIEMNSILIKHGFHIEFPEEVQQEADALQEGIDPAEVHIRRDMRDVPTLTIDPVSAKDFDDALSFRSLDNGSYEVGIHIADVTHYVKERSAMDEEAKKRTTSVYLVDRVCPMLPEKLSNNLCSLRPNVDRYAFSAIFTFSSDHKIQKRWFGKTIIHSNQRFTYEEAQSIIDGASHSLQDEVKALCEVARRLRKKRYQEGSISFETDEVRFELDERGHPLEIYLKERKEAHKLVEDLMLLANKEVATYIVDRSKKESEIPFVYRIHDVPDPDKILDFQLMAKEVGFQFDTNSPEHIAASFNRLVEQAKTDDSLHVLEPLAIRTMAKAVYDVDNIGHYGLGFENYSHFTSPIRRYADVWVHRLLYKNLNGNRFLYDKAKLKSHCAYISTVERQAKDAERESIKYKQTEFIQGKIGQTLPGYISGMIEKGIFVALEGSLAEGLIPFSSLEEAFSIDTRRYKAVGERTGWVLQLGKRVRVKIKGVDLTRREIDMALVTLVSEEQ